METVLQRQTLADLIELTKPRITLLVLFTTCMGAFLAPVAMQTSLVFVVALGVSLASGGVSALNMYLERDLDKKMTRTQNRPLPAQRLDPDRVLKFGLLLSFLGVLIVTMASNVLTGFLVLFSVVSYVLVYTPMKQHSHWALLVGAVPGAMPPLIGWAAASGAIQWPGVLLFSIIFIWQVPHFLAIALFRKEEYAKAGFKILPVVKGDRTTKCQIVIYLCVLWPLSFLVIPLGLAGQEFFLVNSILGALFFVVGLYGLKRSSGLRWARTLFIISLIYLTAIYATLIFSII